MRLTDREVDVMNVLWERGASTVAEVHAGIGDTLAYTTVLSMLRTLERKKAVTRVKEGRAHRYAARLERAATQRRAIAAMAAKFFQGSLGSLLVHVVEHERLDKAEIARLRALLEKSRRDVR
jgi:predicted transcriptional regulator